MITVPIIFVAILCTFFIGSLYYMSYIAFLDARDSWTDKRRGDAAYHAFESVLLCLLASVLLAIYLGLLRGIVPHT